MRPVECVLSALRASGVQPRRSGKGWTCRCPAHDDKSPSLSVGEGVDGRALLKCFAGCRTEQVCAAIGIAEADLFADSRNGATPPRRGASRRTPTVKSPARPPDAAPDGPSFATFDEAVQYLDGKHGKASRVDEYRDAGGQLVGATWRRYLAPKAPGMKRKKAVRPISLGPGGRWQIGAMPAPRPLFNLPALLAASPNEPIPVFEGEPSAEAAITLGLDAATTSSGGAEAANKSDWTPTAGRTVVLFPDADAAGEAYMKDVAQLARAAGAADVRIVRLREHFGLPDHGDLADLLDECSVDADKLEGLRARILQTIAEAPVEPAGDAEYDAGGPVLVRMSDVEPQPVAWLWPGRVALGKLTLIAGDPGLGKSFVSLDMSARLSRGTPWPDAPAVPQTPGGVVLLSAEDDPADTIRPRLDAADADVSRIVLLNAVKAAGGGERCFDLERDLPALETAIANTLDCRLVVIDPITAYLGGTDSHRNAEVRGLLAPLAALAARHRVAVIAVTHLRKGEGAAIYRAIGSIGFAAAARGYWTVSKDRDDPTRRLLLPGKTNIGPETTGLAYTIRPAGNDSAVVAWEPDPVTVTADEALGDSGVGKPRARTERDDAADWLLQYLAEGPQPAADVKREAVAAGHSYTTLRRVKPAIGVETRKAAFGGGWEWSLPAVQDARPDAEGAQ